MTTQEELWNDLTFIKKRIEEQQDYVIETYYKYGEDKITQERFNELYNSANKQYLKFKEQEKKLEDEQRLTIH
jgi:hypothetical protein